jgi:hypothetical protein
MPRRRARFSRSKKSTKGARQGRAAMARAAAGAGKSRPKVAGLSAGSVFDALEKIAGILPHVVKHGRGIFGGSPKIAGASHGLGSVESEAVFQTPASFAIIRNNTTSMSPEQRVDHASKGISGIRRVFCQPFNGVNLQVTASDEKFFWDSTVVPLSKWLDNNTIPINPLLLGGPLAQFAALYDRYVIRKFRLRFTSVQPTTFLGTMAVCIEKDPANLSAVDALSARMVVPSITVPYRVPAAEIFWEYDGPELYYVNSVALNDPATQLPAEQRQDLQFVVKGFDIGFLATTLTATQCSFCDVEIEVDFFDPIAPSSLVGSSLEEQLALTEVRRMFREQRLKPQQDGHAAAVNLESNYRARVHEICSEVLAIPEIHSRMRSPLALPAAGGIDTSTMC